MKKAIALILAVFLALALTACGGGTTPDTTNDGAPASGAGNAQPADSQGNAAGSAAGDDQTALAGQKIGLMIYSTTTPWAINIIETFEFLCSSLGIETAIAEAGNPGEVITAAENLLAANVDGILCAMDGGIANKVQELCDAQGVYVSYTFSNNLLADYYPELEASEYYAGSINSMDYEAGYAMTQQSIDLGANSWVFLGMPEGTAPGIDARAAGFKACLADNGMELLGEARTYDKVEGAQNLITNFPEINGFGSGLNAAKNASGALETAGKMGEVYMFCYEAAESYVQEYFDNASLHGCADGVVGHVELAFALLCNAMTGNRTVNNEGVAIGYEVPYIICYNGEEFATLISNSYDGNLIYNLDEIKNLLNVFNSAAGADTFQGYVDNFTIADLLARRS